MRRAELPDLTKPLKVRRVDDGRQRRFHGDVAVDLITAAPLPGARDVEEVASDGGGSGSSNGGCDGSSSAIGSGSGGRSLGQGWGPRGAGEEVQLPLGRGRSLVRHRGLANGRRMRCWRFWIFGAILRFCNDIVESNESINTKPQIDKIFGEALGVGRGIRFVLGDGFSSVAFG